MTLDESEQRMIVYMSEHQDVTRGHPDDFRLYIKTIRILLGIKGFQMLVFFLCRQQVGACSDVQEIIGFDFRIYLLNRPNGMILNGLAPPSLMERSSIE